MPYLIINKFVIFGFLMEIKYFYEHILAFLHIFEQI